MQPFFYWKRNYFLVILRATCTDIQLIKSNMYYRFLPYLRQKHSRWTWQGALGSYWNHSKLLHGLPHYRAETRKTHIRLHTIYLQLHTVAWIPDNTQFRWVNNPRHHLERYIKPQNWILFNYLSSNVSHYKYRGKYVPKCHLIKLLYHEPNTMKFDWLHT